MNANHSHDEKLEYLKKKIEEGKMRKIQAETRISSLQDQYKKTAAELKALGIDPKKAEETIRQMEAEIEKELAEIEALLPDPDLLS
jgi:predicted  nucleic acid-binding Zn-ribbon protein